MGWVKMSLSAAIYTRVSTEDQAQEGFSLEAQKDKLFEYCKLHGYTISGIYTDEGLSGKNTSRPRLQDLLKDATKGLFDLVLVWDISRISRNTLDLLTIAQHFEKNNIGIKSYSEPTEFDTDEGKFSMQLHGAVAELLRKKIVKNVHLGMNRRAEEGKWNGGRILGYDLINKELVKNDEESKIIKMIFNLYVDGMGCIYIRDKLNSLNLRTKNGKAFTHIAILTILANPAYKGFIRYGKTRFHEVRNKREKQETYTLVIGKHKPIITEEIFNKAQDILQSNRRTTPRMPSKPHLLSGLLRCPECGGKMNHQPQGKRKRNELHGGYYSCSTYKNTRGCNYNLIRAIYIEQAVLERIKHIITSEQIIDDIVNEINSNNNIDTELISKQLLDTEKQINKLSNRLDEIKKDYIAEKILISEYREFKADIDSSLAELKSKKESIELEFVKVINTSYDTKEVRTVLEHFDTLLENADVRMKKQLLGSLIERITLNSDKSLQCIEFNFDVPNQHQDKNVILTCDTVHRDLSA
jgi:site-specific DNA recombinase